MRVFVVRPFGQKEGIDFERVEQELIQSALARLASSGIELTGGTTAEISSAGNIREDMFRLLVVADVVIADVSIHNANVFYELGIRHALRPRHTFLIRSATNAKYPFDLQTDRYFLYDAGTPAGKDGETVAALTQALRSTLAAPGASSPIFQLLPKLRPHDRQSLVTVPSDFVEDVERARQTSQYGELRLFAQEIRGFEWDQEGLRLIGEAQFKLRAYNGAKETFEALRDDVPDDLLVNRRLGTIYQRLGSAATGDRRAELLAESDLAIGRALSAASSPADRAEVLALKASNAKTRWIDEFRAAAPADRRAAALLSSHVMRMADTYALAFAADFDAHYPGVNALAMFRVVTELAAALPDVWAQSFDTQAKADAARIEKEQFAARVAASLELILRVDDALCALDEPPPDPWTKASRADVLLLTAPNRPQRVAQAYRDALSGADWFMLETARRNLGVYADLELFQSNVTAALGVVDEAIAKSRKPQMRTPDRVLLFTGHMVDTPDRDPAKARFPRTPQAEAMARELIDAAVRREVQNGGTVIGIAGGACGSDILFHEVCASLGIETQLLLVLPPRQFQVESVQRGGPDWVERYQQLCERVPPLVLQDREALPNWLANKRDYDLWQRNNQWMMFHALATNAPRLTLIALYNPDFDADGPGGTAHLIALADKWGFKSIELDARKLLTAEPAERK